MTGPNNPSLKIDEFDEDLLDESEMASDIDSDFEMLSEDELDSLFGESEVDDAESKKTSAHAPLPDHLKDFDFGDDDFDDF